MRRVVVIVVGALALAGCVTDGVAYRDGNYSGRYDGGYYAAANDGNGDYYYDRPEVVYEDPYGWSAGGPFFGWGWGFGYYGGFAPWGLGPWYPGPWYGCCHPYPWHHGWIGAPAQPIGMHAPRPMHGPGNRAPRHDFSH